MVTWTSRKVIDLYCLGEVKAQVVPTRSAWKRCVDNTGWMHLWHLPLSEAHFSSSSLQEVSSVIFQVCVDHRRHFPDWRSGWTGSKTRFLLLRNFSDREAQAHRSVHSLPWPGHMNKISSSPCNHLPLTVCWRWMTWHWPVPALANESFSAASRNRRWTMPWSSAEFLRGPLHSWGQVAICAGSDKKLIIPGNVSRMSLHYLEIKFIFSTPTRWQGLMLVWWLHGQQGHTPRASSCCFLCTVLLVIRNDCFSANCFLRFASSWLGYDHPGRRGGAWEMSAKL